MKLFASLIQAIRLFVCAPTSRLRDNGDEWKIKDTSNSSLDKYQDTFT
jgi:hypothetical protein